MATGLLPILLGTATKLTPYVQGQDKEYVATLRLGLSTDTLDATGRVTAERPVPPLDADGIRAVLTRFEGEIDQVPPMFSALHAGGRRLHEWARAGVELPRAPRRVRIHAIELREWAPPLLVIRVACGTGTYIRSLAADLGAAFDCGARLDALERTRFGPLSLADAVPWGLIREGDPAALRDRVRPPDQAVGHLPSVRLGDAAAAQLWRGQGLSSDTLGGAADGLTGPCRLYARDAFIGIGEVSAGGVRALRLLHADHPRSRPVSC